MHSFLSTNPVVRIWEKKKKKKKLGQQYKVEQLMSIMQEYTQDCCIKYSRRIAAEFDAGNTQGIRS